MGKGQASTGLTAGGQPIGGDIGGVTDTVWGSGFSGTGVYTPPPPPTKPAGGADTRTWSWEQTAQLAMPLITMGLEMRKQKQAEEEAEIARQEHEKDRAASMVGRGGNVAAMSQRGPSGPRNMGGGLFGRR